MTIVIQVDLVDEVIPFAQADAEAQGLTLESYIQKAILTAWDTAKKCPFCVPKIAHALFESVDKESIDGN